MVIGCPTTRERVGAGFYQEPLSQLRVAVVLTEALDPRTHRVTPAGSSGRGNDGPDQGSHDPSGRSQAGDDLADIVQQCRRQHRADGFGSQFGRHHLGDPHGMATIGIAHLLPKGALGVGQLAQGPLLVAVRRSSRSDRTHETHSEMNE